METAELLECEAHVKGLHHDQIPVCDAQHCQGCDVWQCMFQPLVTGLRDLRLHLLQHTTMSSENKVREDREHCKI